MRGLRALVLTLTVAVIVVAMALPAAWAQKGRMKSAYNDVCFKLGTGVTATGTATATVGESTKTFDFNAKKYVCVSMYATQAKEGETGTLKVPGLTGSSHTMANLSAAFQIGKGSVKTTQWPAVNTGTNAQGSCIVKITDVRGFKLEVEVESCTD